MSTIISDPDAERIVSSYLLKDLQTFQDDKSLIDPTFMIEESRLKNILFEVNRYYIMYGGLPDEKGFEQMVLGGAYSPDIRNSLLILFSDLKSSSKTITRDQFLYCIEVLKRLQQRRHLFQIATTIKEGLENGVREDELTAKVQAAVYSTEDSTASGILSESSVKDNLDERIALYQDRKARPEAYKGIPTGILTLDNLNSGFFGGELGIILARSGAGKSRLMFSIGYNMFKVGYNVMYVTIEMPKEQVERMFDSRHFKVSATGLRHGKLPGDQEKLYLQGQNLKNHPGDFKIVDIPSNCTPSSLIPIIRRHKSRYPLHAVIVDYINIMSPSTRQISDLPIRWGEIARELKAVARQERVVVVSAVQANRAVLEAKLEEVGQEHMSYSDMIMWHADFSMYLKKAGIEGQIQRELDGMVIKCRDAANKRVKLGVVWDYNFVGDLEDLVREGFDLTTVPIQG